MRRSSFSELAAEIDKTLPMHDAAPRKIYQRIRPLLRPHPPAEKREIEFHVLKEDELSYRL